MKGYGFWRWAVRVWHQVKKAALRCALLTAAGTFLSEEAGEPRKRVSLRRSSS